MPPTIVRDTVLLQSFPSAAVAEPSSSSSRLASSSSGSYRNSRLRSETTCHAGIRTVRRASRDVSIILASDTSEIEEGGAEKLHKGAL